MAISFQSDKEVLRKLRDRLRKMSDEELIKFGKDVRRLAGNPFQRQLMRREQSGSGGTLTKRRISLVRHTYGTPHLAARSYEPPEK